MLRFRMPQGVQDYLPEYLSSKLYIEKKLSEVFEKYAYKRIETPKLECYELFSEGARTVPNNKLFKMSDIDGSLLVLRADMTLPISRVVATKMEDLYPLRLSYVSDSFNLTAEQNRSREFTQAGVELFGVSGPEGDAEVIALAIEALLNAGLKDFQIDIGQVEVLKGVLESANISEKKQKDIIEAIDKKNLIDIDVDDNTAKLINNIAMLYGDVSVLKQAGEYVDNKTSIDALLNLFEINQILSEYQIEKYISFDLGLVNSFSYYSGVVFKGITRHFGAPIFGGGRYDNLCSSFNKNIPATGFAIGIKDLMSAIKESGTRSQSNRANVVIGVEESFDALSTSRKIAQNAIEKGLIVDIFYKAEKNSVKEYARQKKIENIIYINRKGRIEEDIN